MCHPELALFKLAIVPLNIEKQGQSRPSDALNLDRKPRQIDALGHLPLQFQKDYIKKRHFLL